MAMELKKILQDYNIKGLDKIIDRINSNKSLRKMDIDIIESIFLDSNLVDVDNILTNVMLAVNLYNSKYINFPKEQKNNEKYKVNEPNKNIDWSDIIRYLGINYTEIDESVLKQMESATNFSTIIETAKFIKNSRNPENRIINKITDANIIIDLLLYSNKKRVSTIVNFFKNDNKIDTRCLGKAIESIPSIFMDKAPENIPANFELFQNNFKLLKDLGIDVREIIIYKPILMISENLQKLLEVLKSYEKKQNTIILYAGHILINKIDLLEKNISLLQSYGIDINICENGKGFQVLGYLDLENKLAKIKEMGYDNEVLSKPSEALESIRALFISLNYNESKEKGLQYKRGAA